MKRHDTHLLTGESLNGKNEEDEDEHSYSFDKPISSSNNSQDKYTSIESESNGPAHVNFLKLNNITNNIDNTKNFEAKESSIISTKELENIFYIKDNNINKNIDENDSKIIKKKKPKKRKIFVKLRKIKLNNDDIIYNCMTYNPTLKNENIDKRIRYDVVNNEKLLRHCISLTNSNDKKKNKSKERNKLKSNFNFSELKEKEVLYFFYNDDCEGNRKLKNVLDIINKQKQKLLQICSNNFSIKTMKPNYRSKNNSKNFLPEINKSNNQELMNLYELEVMRMLKMQQQDRNKNKKNTNYKKINRNNIKYIRNNKANIYDSNKLDYNNNTNNFFLEKSQKFSIKKNKSVIDSMKYNLRKISKQSFSAKSNRYSNNKNHNNNNNSNNKSNNSIKNINKHNYINNWNNRSEKLVALKNLYHAKPNIKKGVQSVKSATSIIKDGNKREALIKKSNYKEYKKYNDIIKQEKENKKIIEKIIKIQTDFNSNNFNQNNHDLNSNSNFSYFNKHFGNKAHCPLCQAMNQKNEENFKRLGLYHMMPNLSNESSHNSWQNRRIYSALSRILTNKQKSVVEKRSRSKSRSRSKITSKNKSKNLNASISNKETINKFKLYQSNIRSQKNDISLVRKLSINRTTFQKENYSINVQLSKKNQTKKY